MESTSAIETDMNSTVIYPPPPPLIETKGTFTYITQLNTRNMLVNCWQAIELTEMWDFIKKDPGPNGFMFSSAPELMILSKKMEELPNAVGHSGFTAGWTLRQMQFIANYGEEEFKKRWKN